MYKNAISLLGLIFQTIYASFLHPYSPYFLSFSELAIPSSY